MTFRASDDHMRERGMEVAAGQAHLLHTLRPQAPEVKRLPAAALEYQGIR